MQGMAGKEMTRMIVLSCGDFFKLADFGFGIKVGILAFLGCLREALYEDQEPSYVGGCFAGYFLAQLPRECWSIGCERDFQRISRRGVLEPRSKQLTG